MALYFILYSSLLFGYWKSLGLVGCQNPGMSKTKGGDYVFLLAYLCRFWPGIGPDLLGSIIGDGFCRPRVVYGFGNRVKFQTGLT